MGFSIKYQYKLRAAIIQAGFRTIGEFSEKIGVSRDPVSRVINGREIPTQSLARAIAGGLGITVDELASMLGHGN